MKTMPPTIVFAILLAAVLRASGAAELKGSPEELASYLTGLPQIVSLSGEGEVRVPADKAEITLRISTENKSLHDALRVNQEIRGRLISFLKENGFGTNQFQAAKFSSTQKYGMFSEKAKSHRVDHSLKVTVRDETEFQTVAGTVDRWADVHFLGVEVQHSDKDTMKALAQALALDKAAERRKLFEDKLGVKLVAKRFADESAEEGSGRRRAGYYGMRYSSGAMEKSVPGRGPAEQRFVESEASNDFGSAFGEVVFSARVTIDYAVESR